MNEFAKFVKQGAGSTVGALVVLFAAGATLVLLSPKSKPQPAPTTRPGCGCQG